MTKEEEILEFAEHQWGKKDLSGIGNKLGEECGEVLGAIVKIPEGRATLAHLFDEAGDVLIVLSQLAAKHGTTLENIRSFRFATIRARAKRDEQKQS